MRIGLHCRVAGGYAKAVEHAKAAGCAALQVFSSNPRSYRPSAVDGPALDAFAQMRRDAGLDPCAIHTPYLINLASDDPKIAAGSLRLLQSDLAVAARGGMRLVNTHLGSYGTRDRRNGFEAICRALERALEGIAAGVFLVIENSAGAGNLAGGTLAELGAFVAAVPHPQLGVCLDTAHAWAAGYAIDSKTGVDRFIDDADRHIGIEKLMMFHFNDTEVPLGASRDRHWHIGEGNIGFEGFRALLGRAELQGKTAILETPGDVADDIRNVQTILSIQRGAR
ncbi:MAG: deoxyribonuclease IV [Candidatus Eremiobacteraeota bacterium]|nr:deoxyribonuclease IV [Candidatus Eremiobacteraeota bacterium]MBV8373066.1 deoxyribonuclease IV [Candidatus Eremiobacteraeota bacterium]